MSLFLNLYCVLIIFFIIRQAVIIAILVKANVIQQNEALTKYGFKDVAVSMQVSHVTYTYTSCKNHALSINIL